MPFHKIDYIQKPYNHLLGGFMSYTKNQQGQVTVFQTLPEHAPIPFQMLWLGIVPSIWFAFIGWQMVVGTFVLFGTFAWLQSILPSARRYRKPSKFTVSPDEVTVDGKQIARRDIHRVILRNHVLSDYVPVVVVSSPHNVIDQTDSGAKIGALHKSKLGAVSYRVDVEAGGVATTLAGGLNETTAFGVLSDVSSVLGMSVS
jgi:hypothetical protein